LVQGLKEKRYFVVLDDLWSIDAWNWINDISFPKNNNRGSRILVTTRDAGLAESCTSQPLIYHLEPLQMDDAVDLLLRKTSKRQQVLETGENMKHIVTKLVKKCGCLPLAILTVGGILATKKIAQWGKFFEELPSELESNPSLEAMRRMVTLSYDHLPSHLKPCFLYLSIFPEDFEIQRRRLVGRWIAEGLVKVRDGVNIEEVGNSYFNELINRSMIQPSTLNVEGVVKKCTIHDIVRDIIVSISREEKFVLLTKDNVTNVEEENIRHVAFHGNKCSEIGLNWSSVRSISVFGDRPMEPAPSFCSPQLRMLRVLDLEDAKFKITEKDANNIGALHHMKYLNISGTSYNFALLRSIGKLRCLQTLDLRETNIAALTTDMTELRNLRSLRCSKRLDYGYFNLMDNPKGCLTITMCVPMIFTPLVNFSDRANLMSEVRMACSTRWSDTKGVRLPRGINHLKKLQVLEVVDIKGTSRKVIKEVGELSQLRKLSVTSKGATEDKYMILCAAIEKLSSLQSLHVDAEGSSDVESLEWLAFISSPPALLRSLKLNGSLADMPNWFGNLKQLVKMHLSRSRLKEDKTMEILGALPNLMLLRLYRNAYVGEKLVFRRGAFPNLKEVDIYFLKQVREIIFEEGTSPHLGSIEIYGCRLESGIVGIKHLPRLKIIALQYDDDVAKFDMLHEEVDAHPNHPVLQMSNVQR
jgi:disease resistance protein RPM1